MEFNFGLYKIQKVNMTPPLPNEELLHHVKSDSQSPDNFKLLRTEVMDELPDNQALLHKDFKTIPVPC